MATLQDYNNSESATLSLNERGIAKLKRIVEEHASFNWTGTQEQIAALSQNDAGFDEYGYIKLELSPFETKNHQPYAYELEFEDHFDVVIK